MNKIFPVLKRNLSHVCNLKPYKETKWLMPNGNPTGVYVYNCVAEERVPVILNDPTMATWRKRQKLTIKPSQSSLNTNSG
ncbi:unnamed protein product [Colias eurytheme]|nr:unnamed protein product [Colias eurytheme]